MLESRVLRYSIYGTCAIICSELLYHSYHWLRNWLVIRSQSQEICEVLWTNELSQSCAAAHHSNESAPANYSGNMRDQRRFAKLKPSANVICRNPYCGTYNFGRVIEFIDSAKYSIDLAMYTLTSFEISEAFGRAFNRGVFIRIISDHEMAYSSCSQIVPLVKAGVPTRCNNNTSFMHHKFCVIDGPQRVTAIFKKQNKSPNKGPSRGIVMTGSLNWTIQGFTNNWENILITSNAEFVSKYSAEFERLWHVFDVDFKPNEK